MNFFRFWIAALFVPALAAQPAALITFEGLADHVPVGDYYNGGEGGNLGISFNKRFHAETETGGTVAVVEPGSGSSAIINVPEGFEGSLSLLYSGPGNTVVLFDQPNGRGLQLSLTTLQANTADTLIPAKIRFSGKARSVLFGFVGYGARKTVIDNLEFGRAAVR